MEWKVEGVCVRESSDVIKGECGECVRRVCSLSLCRVFSLARSVLSLSELTMCCACTFSL